MCELSASTWHQIDLSRRRLNPKAFQRAISGLRPATEGEAVCLLSIGDSSRANLQLYIQPYNTTEANQYRNIQMADNLVLP